MIAVLAMVYLGACDEAPIKPTSLGDNANCLNPDVNGNIKENAVKCLAYISPKNTRDGDVLQWVTPTLLKWCQLPPSKIEPQCVPAIVEE